MKRFTIFTLLYLAVAVCLSAIALGHPDMTPSLKKILLTNAGILYLFCVLSTFPFWHQSGLRSQNRLQQQSTWRQNFVAIAPWLIIGVTLFSSIFNLLSNNWTTEAIIEASSGLAPILVSVEMLYVRSQTRS